VSSVAAVVRFGILSEARLRRRRRWATVLAVAVALGAGVLIGRAVGGVGAATVAGHRASAPRAALSECIFARGRLVAIMRAPGRPTAVAPGWFDRRLADRAGRYFAPCPSFTVARG